MAGIDYQRTDGSGVRGWTAVLTDPAEAWDAGGQAPVWIVHRKHHSLPREFARTLRTAVAEAVFALKVPQPEAVIADLGIANCEEAAVVRIGTAGGRSRACSRLQTVCPAARGLHWAEAVFRRPRSPRLPRNRGRITSGMGAMTRDYDDDPERSRSWRAPHDVHQITAPELNGGPRPSDGHQRRRARPSTSPRPKGAIEELRRAPRDCPLPPA
jgi:hypothetical protein